MVQQHLEESNSGQVGMSDQVRNWPIGVAMMAFAGRQGGRDSSQLPPECRGDLCEVREVGFDYIDLTDNWLELGNLEPSSFSDLVAALQEYDLAVSAVSLTRHSVIDPNTAIADANLDYTLRSVRAAAEVGAKVISIGFHRPLLDTQRTAQWFWHAEGAKDRITVDTKRLASNRVREIAYLAGEYGMQVSLEMYEDTILGTSDHCLDFLDEVALPNVGLNPDIGNIVRLHRPIEHWEEMLRKMLPHSNYWHIKNYIRDEDSQSGAYMSAPAALEFGYIDYSLGIELALASGFQGPFCVEHYGGDQLSNAARNREYIRHILQRKLKRKMVVEDG